MSREMTKAPLIGTAAFWPITPCPAPRQVQSDKWKRGMRVRPAVGRYRAFCDEVRLRQVWIPSPGDLVVFCMPIRASASPVVIDGLDGRPHCIKPDVDNLLKALLDALLEDDCMIWTLTAAKVWSAKPGIYIERRAPLATPFVVPVCLRRP